MAKPVALLKTCDPDGQIDDIVHWQKFYEKPLFNEDIQYVGSTVNKALHNYELYHWLKNVHERRRQNPGSSFRATVNSIMETPQLTQPRGPQEEETEEKPCMPLPTEAATKKADVSPQVTSPVPRYITPRSSRLNLYARLQRKPIAPKTMGRAVDTDKGYEAFCPNTFIAYDNADPYKKTSFYYNNFPLMMKMVEKRLLMGHSAYKPGSPFANN